MPSEKTARRSFVVLMVGSIVLLAVLLRPLATSLILAAVLAGILWPLQRWLARKLRNRPRLAAGLLVIGVILLLLGPLAALSAVAVKEASDGLNYVSETLRSDGVAGLLEDMPAPVRKLVVKAMELVPKEPGQNLEESLRQQVTAQQGTAAAAVGGAMAATGSFLFQAVMTLIALFFLLVHAKESVAWLDRVSPLPRGQTLELLAEVRNVSIAVVGSSVITGGIQALAALIGYYIARAPRPVFFAGVTFFAAFIPAIGAGAVCVGVGGLLFLTGHPYMAIFLALWGLLVVGLVDNLAKPLLIKRGMELNGAIVFFALIGGLAAFGAIGLVLGPLVVALFLALLRIYKRDYERGEAASDAGA